MKVGVLWTLRANHYWDCCNYDSHGLKVRSIILFAKWCCFILHVYSYQANRALKVSVSLGTPIENEVLCRIRHSWQMPYVNQKEKKKENPYGVQHLSNENKASQGRSLGGFWSQIARNKCAILILALKLPLLEWSQSHNLCSTTHFKVETRFLVYFLQKKKIIRALDEIRNPSYTNLRSSRRFYNLIPKQAAKKGILQEKRLFFFPSSSFVWISEAFSWASRCSDGFCPFLFPLLRGCAPHPPWRERALVQQLALDLCRFPAPGNVYLLPDVPQCG